MIPIGLIVFCIMYTEDTNFLWNPKFPVENRPADPTKHDFVQALWTRLWKIGDFETGCDIRIVDRAACGKEVYGELAILAAIIVPAGGENVVCLVKLSNPDVNKCERIKNSQLGTLQRLKFKAGEGVTKLPKYRDDHEYVCVLLKHIQLALDLKQHRTPLFRESTGTECVRGVDGFDYNGESKQYHLCYDELLWGDLLNFSILAVPPSMNGPIENAHPRFPMPQNLTDMIWMLGNFEPKDEIDGFSLHIHDDDDEICEDCAYHEAKRVFAIVLKHATGLSKEDQVKNLPIWKTAMYGILRHRYNMGSSN